MDNKIKHLEMIQSVINRMAAISFHIKGWSVVLVSALFALSAPDSRINLVYIACNRCTLWSIMISMVQPSIINGLRHSRIPT